MSFGRSNQLTAVALNNPTSIGCKTLTPTRAAMTPVIAGKMDPPIWPRTKTNAGRGSKSLQYQKQLKGSAYAYRSLERPCQVERFWIRRIFPVHVSWLIRRYVQIEQVKKIHTVAKKGPEKTPIKLTATASVIIFGTLLLAISIQSKERDRKNSQPKHKLQPNTQNSIHKNHPPLTQPMRRFCKKKSSQKTTTR